jgi:hypothetical protein
MGDVWRKMFHWLIEVVIKNEMGDVWGKMFNWLIEAKTKSEMGEVRRKIFNWLIEMITKLEMSDGRRICSWLLGIISCDEEVHWFVMGGDLMFCFSHKDTR